VPDMLPLCDGELSEKAFQTPYLPTSNKFY